MNIRDRIDTAWTLAMIAIALAVLLTMTTCEDNERPVPYDANGNQIDDGSGRGAFSM